MSERFVITTEFLLIFIVGPLVPLLLPLPSPLKLSFLLLTAIYCLWRLKTTDKPPAHTLHLKALWAGIILRTGVFACLGAAATWWLIPDDFLRFPRTRPMMWLTVMLLYPWLSALPQEVIYRRFFFRRFQPAAPLAVNVLLFAWLHISYLNLPALLLSGLGGWILAHQWRRHNNLAAVAIEHALYGMIVFSIGLGRFFYRAG